MKRIFCIALCALLALSVTACGDKKPTEPAATSAVATEAPATKDEAAANSTMKDFIARFDDTPTVGDQPVYEDENLTVTAHGINYAPIAGPEVRLTIENRYKQDITVQSPDAVVNGYMISPQLEISVPAGKTVSGNLSLSYFSLALADITRIREIEFSLRVTESKDYNNILLTTDVLSIRTSAANATPDTAAPDDSGQVAYDKDKVKIVLKGVGSDRPDSDDPELTVYLYNGTEKAVKICTDSVIVNGYDMTSAMNLTVLPGKRAVDCVPFYRQDLDEYDIEEIDSVQVSFSIRDAESWKKLASTDLIDVAV